jgi:hypothetical protein
MKPQFSRSLTTWTAWTLLNAQAAVFRSEWCVAKAAKAADAAQAAEAAGLEAATPAEASRPGPRQNVRVRRSGHQHLEYV